MKPEWLDFVTGLSTNVSVIITVIGASWWLRAKTVAETQKIREETESIRLENAQIKHQVTNTHSTNLRDDVDVLGTKLDRLGESVSGLSARLNTQAIALDTYRSKTEAFQANIMTQIGGMNTTLTETHGEVKRLKTELGEE